MFNKDAILQSRGYCDKILKNVWQKRNIANLRDLRLWLGGWGGSEWRKLWTKEIENVGSVSEKTFFIRKRGGWPRKYKAQRSIPVSCMQSPSRLQSQPAFLWRLPTFSQTGWRSRLASFDVIKLLGLSSKHEYLSSSTRLLGQVALPIWPGDLQCGHALI